MSTGARLTAVGFLHRMTRMGCRIRLLCLFHLGNYKTHLSNWIKSSHTSGSVCTVNSAALSTGFIFICLTRDCFGIQTVVKCLLVKIHCVSL